MNHLRTDRRNTLGKFLLPLLGIWKMNNRFYMSPYQVINSDACRRNTRFFLLKAAKQHDIIRASEKVFYRQVLEIYATSIDYDLHADISMEFFKKSRI